MEMIYLIKLIVMGEGTDFDCKDKEDVVKAIMEEYHRNDICIGELLYGLEIKGLSIQDVVDVFAKVMHTVEDDKLIQVMEEHAVPRWVWCDAHVM